MILEAKQVLFREQVHSLERRSRNAYDHLEQAFRKSSSLKYHKLKQIKIKYFEK